MKKILIVIMICFSFVLSGCSNSSDSSFELYEFTKELDVLNVHTGLKGRGNIYYHVQAVKDDLSVVDISFFAVSPNTSISIGDFDKVYVTYETCDNKLCAIRNKRIDLILTEETIKSMNYKEDK